MILVAMHALSQGTTKALKYEDIVVKAFKTFPNEFALRGYPEYPDSSDLHKPLYGPLKRGGLVRSANKTFALTPKGVQAASRLLSEKVDTGGANGDRLTRDVANELDRMLRSPAFELFLNGAPHRILDTDFYAFVGCTVRTPKNDFLGRITATNDAVRAAHRLRQPNPEAAAQLAVLWKHLREHFKPLVEKRRGA